MSFSSGLIAAIFLAYMALLFGIAFYGERRPALSPRLGAWVFSLSLAVWCTSWTFFGAVGQAAVSLWSFVPIYLGPALLMLLAPHVLRKMVLISKQENITSIADFIASRYGKSQTLAIAVTLICLVSVLPYIALQLKGIVLGVSLLTGTAEQAAGPAVQDTALVTSLLLALFAILFGTRNLDATEHHRGMVLAIAFESVIKLLAFLAVGVFVTWGLYNGFDDLLSQARSSPSWTHSGAGAMTGSDCLPRPALPWPRSSACPGSFMSAWWKTTVPTTCAWHAGLSRCTWCWRRCLLRRSPWPANCICLRVLRQTPS